MITPTTLEITGRGYSIDLPGIGVSAVYKITNTTNGKIYIGSSGQVRFRIKSHFKSLIKRKHFIPEMQSDFNNGDKFTWEIIEDLSKSKINYNYMRELEYRYIKQVNPSHLYNRNLKPPNYRFHINDSRTLDEWIVINCDKFTHEELIEYHKSGTLPKIIQKK